ncbi:hypothetical protein RYX36_019468, partial [Vicia faba]
MKLLHSLQTSSSFFLSVNQKSLIFYTFFQSSSSTSRVSSSLCTYAPTVIPSFSTARTNQQHAEFQQKHNYVNAKREKRPGDSYLILLSSITDIRIASKRRLGAIEAGLPLWLRPYEVLCTSSYTTLIETIPDTASLHSIKSRYPNNSSLREFFDTKYYENTPSFKLSQRKFVESMAGYYLVCYFLQSQISNEENERNYENLSVSKRSKVIETGGSSPALDGSLFPSENSFANEMPTVQVTAAETGGSSPDLDERTVTKIVGSSPSPEKSFVNKMLTIQTAVADPEEGNTK